MMMMMMIYISSLFS